MSERPEMEYFMNESLSDVVFVVEGQQIPALKVILSLKSKVFRAMFSGLFKESKVEEVVIEETTFEAFKTFIQFLYLDQLVLTNDKDFKLIQKICKLSDKYDTPLILERVSEHLVSMQLSHSDMTSLKWITRIAFKYNLEEVMAKVMAFIDSNKYFNHFLNKSITEILELNELSANRFMEVIVNNHRKVNDKLTQVERQLADIQRDHQKVSEELIEVKRRAKMENNVCRHCEKSIKTLQTHCKQQ